MTRRRRKPGAASAPSLAPGPPGVPPSPSPSSSSSSSSSSSLSSSSSSSSPFHSSKNIACAPPGISEFPSAAGVAASTAITVSPASAASSPSVTGATSAVIPHVRPSSATYHSSSSSFSSSFSPSSSSSGGGGLPAVFLPGDPLLPLVSGETGEEGRETTATAVQRLSELLWQYDTENPAITTAIEGRAVAAQDLHAATGAGTEAVSNIVSSTTTTTPNTPTGGGVVSGVNSSTEQTRSTSLLPCVFTSRFPLFPYSPAYLSSCMQRYEPLEGDVVLGLVNGKLAGEFYTVSIRSRMDALLPQISSFEGATKQQRPRLRSGSVVLCRVGRAAIAAAAELTCIDVNCKKAWYSKEKIYGELQGGCLLDVPPPLATSLMAPHCFVLEALGEKMKFEVAAAANGRIWVKANAAGDIVLIANVLLASYGKEPHVIQAIVNALLSRRHENKVR